MDASRTLVAVATAPGHAGVGVVRVSGPLAHQVAGGVLGKVPQPREALFAAFHDAAGGVIDRGVAIWFAAPASYTGEDTLELQAHGNPLLLAALVRRCMELGAQPAGPGEFTERAFLNGKLSLDQAEAVADLIAADSQAALDAARRSLGGGFAETVDALADELTAVRALVEASLDFPEESDIDWLQRLDLLPRLAVVAEKLAEALAAAQRGVRLREGYRVVIVGRPNAGKSTLLNHLTDAGVLVENRLFATLDATTRRLRLPGGETVLLTDTVGFITKLPTQLVEAFKSTLEVVVDADLLVHVVDGSAPEPDENIEAVDRVLVEIGAADVPQMVVVNKVDRDREDAKRVVADHPGSVAVSARTGEGIDAMLRALADRLRGMASVTELLVPFERGDVLAALHREGEVLVEEATGDGMRVRARLDAASAGQFRGFVVTGQTLG